MAASYLNQLRYISVPDATTVNVRSTPGGSVLYRLYHGTPVKLYNYNNTSSEYDFVIAWEPSARNGYVKKEYVVTSEPSNSRDWELQLFGPNDLEFGSSGVYVMNLQGYLQEYVDSSLKRDGDFGTLTENAVKAFQTSKGLTADGIVGARTKERLAALERVPNGFFTYPG